MKKRVTPILLLICGLALPAAAQRLYPIYPAQGSVVMDGKLEEAAWRGAPVADDFFPVGTAPSGQPTRFRMLYDSTNLYIAVQASERNMTRLQLLKNDGEKVWTDDAIEIYLSTGNERVYQRFAVNAAGKRSDTRISAGADRGTEGYTLEIGLPFALFPVPPKPGAVIRGNVCRNRLCGAQEYSAWSGVERSFNEQGNFAELWLRPVPAVEDQVAQINRFVNLAYSIELVGNARDVIRQCAELNQCLKKYGLPDKAMEPEVQNLAVLWRTRSERAGRYVAYFDYFRTRCRAPDFWEGKYAEFLGKESCPTASEFRIPFRANELELLLTDYFRLKRLFDE